MNAPFARLLTWPEVCTLVLERILILGWLASISHCCCCNFLSFIKVKLLTAERKRGGGGHARRFKELEFPSFGASWAKKSFQLWRDWSVGARASLASVHAWLPCTPADTHSPEDQPRNKTLTLYRSFTTFRGGARRALCPHRSHIPTAC